MGAAPSQVGREPGRQLATSCASHGWEQVARVSRGFGIVALLLLPMTVVCQDLPVVDVTGIVADVSTGEPVSGAAVWIQGTQVRTLTDEDGRFLLRDIPQGEHTWVIESLGYARWEQPLVVEHMDRLKIGLMPRPVALQEIRATVSRLETRRKLATVSIHTANQDRIGASIAIEAAGAVRSLMPWFPAACPAGQTPAPSMDLRLCIRYRGVPQEAAICLDERPASMAELWAYGTAELHSIDYVGGASPQVRVYTIYFLERGKRLRPLSIGCA